MEQALRIQPEDEFPAPLETAAPRTETDGVSEGIEKVLRFAAPPRQGETDGAAKVAGPVTARDFAAAMDFVREGAQAIRAAEDRTREAEARTQNLAQRAAEELKNAELRIQSLEARARAADNRAQEAESRAKEADAWLRQILNTIAEELPIRRPSGA